jgi:hypothetical protein
MENLIEIIKAALAILAGIFWILSIRYGFKYADRVIDKIRNHE